MQKNHPDFLPPIPCRAGQVLCLIFSLFLFVTVLSFGFWEGGEGGALSAAALWVENVLTENEAVAVFLGLAEGGLS